MSWLSHLTFAQALRWSLVWPALLLVAVVAAGVYLRFGAGEWAVAWHFESASGVSARLALAVAGALVVLGPALAFLALWRVVQRR